MKEMKEDEKELKGVEATSLEGGPTGGTEQGGNFSNGGDEDDNER